MALIVIPEFMDERAVAQLRAAHEVLYDPKLIDDAPRLLAEVQTMGTPSRRDSNAASTRSPSLPTRSQVATSISSAAEGAVIELVK